MELITQIQLNLYNTVLLFSNLRLQLELDLMILVY
jgi:hypothetical protein